MTQEEKLALFTKAKQDAWRTQPANMSSFELFNYAFGEGAWYGLDMADAILKERLEKMKNALEKIENALSV